MAMETFIIAIHPKKAQGCDAGSRPTATCAMDPRGKGPPASGHEHGGVSLTRTLATTTTGTALSRATELPGPRAVPCGTYS